MCDESDDISSRLLLKVVFILHCHTSRSYIDSIVVGYLKYHLFPLRKVAQYDLWSKHIGIVCLDAEEFDPIVDCSGDTARIVPTSSPTGLLCAIPRFVSCDQSISRHDHVCNSGNICVVCQCWQRSKFQNLCCHISCMG